MKIRLLETDGWQGLYVDGDLRLENHELDTEDVINCVAPDTDFKRIWVDELEENYCPENWTEELENKI